MGGPKHGGSKQFNARNQFQIFPTGPLPSCPFYRAPRRRQGPPLTIHAFCSEISPRINQFALCRRTVLGDVDAVRSDRSLHPSLWDILARQPSLQDMMEWLSGASQAHEYICKRHAAPETVRDQERMHVTQCGSAAENGRRCYLFRTQKRGQADFPCNETQPGS